MENQSKEFYRAIISFAFIAILLAIAAHICYLEQLNY